MSISRTELPNATAHYFTVDVEEYFQVNAFEGIVPRERWDSYPSRLARSMDLLLDRLAAHGSTGTFFTLGWVADRHPAIVRRIAEAGHEVASHGYWHRRVTMLTPEAFREDVRASRAALENVTGQAVVGYRAPSFSIVPGREWALDILLEEGFRYDSSLFPIRRPGYGYPDAPTEPHVIERPAGRLVELPPATTTILGRRIPVAGGGYLRQLPFAMIRGAFRDHARRGVPAMFYIHPWEIDPGQPRMPVSFVTRLRHYRGLADTLGKIEALLSEFRFTAVAPTLGAIRAPLAAVGGAASRPMVAR
ncbi:MAG TPA: XrtA system polysaccharide deacetylase [Gemmatimonadaceae bacterium]|nr:XrtA system polysaccharide deacetylase [Gemmatimonadaceae bacterium]